MNPRILSVLSLLFALVFGTLFALEKRRNGGLTTLAESTRKSLAALTEQADRDRAELEKLRQQIDVYRQESDALRTKLADAKGGGAGSTGGAGPSPEENPKAGGKQPGARLFEGIAKMYSDPKMKKAMQAQQAIGIRMMYGDFFKEHPLDADVAQRVSDILAERQMEMSAAGLSAMNGANPEAGEAANPGETKKRYDDLLKGTLGDENYEAFKTYEETIGERFMLQQYDAQFATAGAPLAADQRETLLSIMSEERKNAPASSLRNAGQNPQAQMEALRDPAAVDSYMAEQEALNRRVLTRARESLSADQVVALEKGQNQMLEMMRAQMAMAREMFGK